MIRYFTFAFLLEALCASISPYLQIMLRNRGYSQTIVGIIIAFSQIVGLLFPLINGAKIDKRGRFKIRLFIYTIILLICFMLFSTNLFVINRKGLEWISVFLYASVFTLGVGCYSVLNPAMDAYMSRNLEGDSSKYGKIRASGTMGYVSLLVIAALMAFPKETNNTQISLNISVCGILFIIVLLLMPSFKMVKKADSAFNKLNQTKKKNRSLKQSLSWISRPFAVFMTIFTVYRMGMAIVEMMLGSYMTEVLQLGSSFTLYVALASFSEIFSLIIAGRLVKKDKVSTWLLLLISCMAMILRLFIYAFTKTVEMFALSQILHAFTFGTGHIAATGFISKYVEKEHASKAMALYWVLSNNLVQFIGPLFGGVIIDNLGYKALFLIYSIFPAISCVLCFTHKKTLTTGLSLNKQV